MPSIIDPKGIKKNNTNNKKTPKSTRRGTTVKKYEQWVTKKGLEQIKAWAMNGLIDTEICKKIGIHISTLFEWKHRFPELAEALKNSKDVVDDMVEQALLKRATGYEVEEIEESETIDPRAGTTTRTKTTTKHLTADTIAQIFWLKNRRPDKWRSQDKVVIENNTAESDLHQATLLALKNRIVPDLLENTEAEPVKPR
jgi:hypothetical protein